MALIKCTECGKDISNKAAVCPHCGCPMEEILKIISMKESDASEDCLVNEKKDNCIYKGEIYNFQGVQEIIDSYHGDIKPDCFNAICSYFSENFDFDTVDIMLLSKVIKFNNNQIPKDFDKALEEFRAYNRSRHPTCPTCGSQNLKKLTHWEKSWLSGTLDKTFKCQHCGYTW